MRLLFLMGLCILFNGCNHDNSYHRGYVISKSNEAAVEEDLSTEEPLD